MAAALRLRFGRLSLEMVRRTISFASRTAPALLCVLVLPSAVLAQGVPRIKATIISFDGKLLSLKAGDPQPMTVGLMPDTRIVRQEKRALADIRPGDYIGATITVAKDGSRHAQEVHVFPPALRGSGEGIFAMDGGRFMIDGTVDGAAPNLLTLAYRGAEGGEGMSCTGRAPRSGGCDGRVDILVAAGVPVTALVDGDKSLLVPGAVLAISILAGPDGHPVTPGITVQGMAGAEPVVKPPVTPPVPPPMLRH